VAVAGAQPAERETELLRRFSFRIQCLFIDGVGLAVANDAYASRRLWQMFERDLYHRRASCGGEINMLLAALATRTVRRPVESVRSAAQRSGLHTPSCGATSSRDRPCAPVRYGSSSDVQLWKLTDLAVQYLSLSRPTQ